MATNHEIDNTKYPVYHNIIRRGDWKNSQRLLQLVHELEPDIVNIQYETDLFEVDTSLGHITKRVISGSTLDLFYERCPVPTVSTLHTVRPFSEYHEYIKERASRNGRKIFPAAIANTLCHKKMGHEKKI